MLLMSKEGSNQDLHQPQVFSVFKYPVPLDDYVEIQMPIDARIIKFDVQTLRDDGREAQQLVLWAVVPLKEQSRTRTRRFRIAGTGHHLVLGGGDLWHYIDTAQMLGGQLIWHCFEILYPVPDGYAGTVPVPPEIDHYKVKF